jgi:hypothetical protein
MADEEGRHRLVSCRGGSGYPPVARMLLAVVLAAFALASHGKAQSLDPRNPTSLQPGENHGTIDNQTGAQFWALHYNPGAATIAVRFTSMGIFGNPMSATVNVVVLGPGGKIIGHQQLTSAGQAAELHWPGKFDKSGLWIIEVQPMGSNIVRNGGDYTITVNGPAIAAGAGGGPSPNDIVGTYAVMSCPPDFQCDGLGIRFAPGGEVRTTDGHQGHWALFDPDARVYTVVIGRDRWTVKLVPGRGLMDTHDQTIVIFQAIRPH